MNPFLIEFIDEQGSAPPPPAVASFTWASVLTGAVLIGGLWLVWRAA